MQALLPYSHKHRFSVLSIAFTIFFVSILSSCGTIKNSYYFKEIKKDTTLSTFLDSSLQIKIQKNDILSITISSLSKDEDLIYNSSSIVQSGSNASNTSSSSGGMSQYKVDSSGNIQIHNIGSVNVEGLTLIQLKTLLEQKLATYLKDAIVTTSFVNHFVTIMGSVTKPQVLMITNDQPMTILNALTMSGDITDNGSKNDVLVIRESRGTKQFKRLNLERGDFFNSQWYYLQPNDIVYVSPNIRKAETDENRLKVQQLVTIASVAVSMTIILVDRIIK